MLDGVHFDTTSPSFGCLVKHQHVPIWILNSEAKAPPRPQAQRGVNCHALAYALVETLHIMNTEVHPLRLNPSNRSIGIPAQIGGGIGQDEHHVEVGRTKV